MSLPKITIAFLCCLLFSCNRQEPDRIVTQDMPFGIKPNQGPLIDTTRYTICGLGMAQKLGLNPDPAFTSFWESFCKGVAKRSYVTLMDMTRFPLRSGIGNEKESFTYYEKKHFRKAFSTFLSAEIDSRKKSERINDLSSLHLVTAREDSAIIEGMVFKKIRSRWFLTALYKQP